MTPKEKAEELVNKYLLATPIPFHIEDAKQCALICVDEILQEIENIDDGQTFIPYEYWGQVKKEIELL
jgi:hypothetical protein